MNALENLRQSTFLCATQDGITITQSQIHRPYPGSVVYDMRWLHHLCTSPVFVSSVMTLRVREEHENGFTPEALPGPEPGSARCFPYSPRHWRGRIEEAATR